MEQRCMKRVKTPEPKQIRTKNRQGLAAVKDWENAADAFIKSETY